MDYDRDAEVREWHHQQMMMQQQQQQQQLQHQQQQHHLGGARGVMYREGAGVSRAEFLDRAVMTAPEYYYDHLSPAYGGVRDDPYRRGAGVGDMGGGFGGMSGGAAGAVGMAGVPGGMAMPGGVAMGGPGSRMAVPMRRDDDFGVAPMHDGYHGGSSLRAVDDGYYRDVGPVRPSLGVSMQMQPPLHQQQLRGGPAALEPSRVLAVPSLSAGPAGPGYDRDGMPMRPDRDVGRAGVMVYDPRGYYPGGALRNYDRPMAPGLDPAVYPSNDVGTQAAGTIIRCCSMSRDCGCAIVVCACVFLGQRHLAVPLGTVTGAPRT